MRLLTESGGVKTTIVAEYMQRAPVFYFGGARQTRAFGHWVEENFEGIRAAAESTTRSGKLRRIEQYTVGATKLTGDWVSSHERYGRNR